MKVFMDQNFLLNNETAVKLFHDYAEDLPIYDYHCHINPQEILENKYYSDITELWLGGDHYKWRLMRAYGIDEEYCTGNADPYEKFAAYCRALGMSAGNPLYHWSHMELKKYFGITDIIQEKNAKTIWEKANAKLGEKGLRCRDFITMSGVKVICTTDDPADDLHVHQALKKEDLQFRVLPAFRPDNAIEIGKPTFGEYIKKLATASGSSITSFQDMKNAMKSRLEYFHQNGCRLSDTGLMRMPWCLCNEETVDAIFRKRLAGTSVTLEEEMQYKTALMLYLGKLYGEKGWCMQLHLGPMRNNNGRKFREIGPDTGFDSVSDEVMAIALSRFLDHLEEENILPKTILYTLNPKDYPVLISMTGNFQSEISGKIQLGAAWWFNDHKNGIEEQLKVLAAGGALGTFVGMLTDSRSFTSYARHDYFRRILCNLLGEWVEKGEFAPDWEILKILVQNISYYNAETYFNM